MNVWQVKMGDAAHPKNWISKKNVCAATLTDAVNKAETSEREECANRNDSDGESFEPDTAVAVCFVCTVNDD